MVNEKQKYYAQRTSQRSEKLIIDLFNRLNKDEGFSMKTVTTIYKKNEIFKGNARYPIDAPFRDFYVDLTENYAFTYKLDDLFFHNNKIISGQFYFEFNYNKNRNEITIYKFPDELNVDIVMSYTPMLFSMFSGLEIDWEDARKKIVFSNESFDNKNKILVVFGEDKLRSLNFSWVSVFEINCDENIESISKKIRNQEDEIVNSIQGVLFSELENVFIDYLDVKSKKDYSDWVRADYNHTIRNLGVKGAFYSLYKNLLKYPDTMDNFDRLENIYTVQIFATDILNSVSSNKQVLLLEKQKVNTYTSILDLLHNSSIRHKEYLVKYSENLIDHHKNKIASEDLSIVFRLLFNLYSNCAKHSKGDYNIDIIIAEDSNLQITFDNKGLMDEDYKNFILGNRKKVEGEGMKYVKDSLKKLKSKVQIIFSDSFDRTIIILKFIDYGTNK